MDLHALMNWAPVLVYHEVLPDGTDPLPPYSITVSGLRETLRDFTERGYTSGTLDDLVYGSNGNTLGVRKKPLVLTFDDGTRDFLDYALPVLEEFKFSATLFVIAGMVGGRRNWVAPGLGSQGLGTKERQRTPTPNLRPLTPAKLMDGADLRALHAKGFAIGSHTLTHAALPGLADDEAMCEIAASREHLRDLLGEEVRWFAYPYLMADAKSRAMVRDAGYEGACGGYNRPHSRYYLNRIDPTAFTVPQLRLRTNRLYHMIRTAVRRVRYGKRLDS